ncbi:unnamed protein product [Malus baccata var. baccata]
MASLSRRDDGDSPLPAKAPTFFKIVLDKALRDGRLEIPPAFVMKNEDCLADSVFLKDPTGRVWRIELTRRCGKVWLQKGWSEFAKFYSLNHGYLLVFSHEGGFSHFLVRIFQRNTLEIDYPISSSHDGVPMLCGGIQLPKKEEHGDNVSLKILDSPRPKTRSGGGMHTDEEKTTRLSDRAFSRAVSFKSSNPFLVVKIQPSYIASQLRLPGSFVRRHICARGVCDMNLEISSRRSWPVKCRVGVYRRKQYARVYDGWKAFARENRVKVGDACVFELINKGGTRSATFKVGIYRA